MANGIWSTGERADPRRGAWRAPSTSTRPRPAAGSGRTWQAPLTHGRAYSEDELWDNYAYFIRKVVPVAEEAGVYIGIHPDDPPVYPLGGVPRCIFGNFDGYKRALEIADSPNVGMCLCVGCWLEGGPAMGKDVARDHPLLWRRSGSCSRCTSATSRRRCPTSSRPSSTTATWTCTA